MLIQFFQEHGRRLLRYASVSVVGVICGQSLLLLFYRGVGLGAAQANLLAVTIATVPSYLLNRAWVWGKTGGHSVRAEIVPFWGMAFLGLALSTVLVHFAEEASGSWVWVNAANLAAFGSLWIAKYLLLDRVLFAHDEALAPIEALR